MSIANLSYQTLKPKAPLSDFVESFWMLVNHSEEPKEVVIVPDGRVDIFFSSSSVEPYHVTLMGLETTPTSNTIAPKTVIFAVSFKLLAIEYILKTNISTLLNKACFLPLDFWDITAHDLHNFEGFCTKVSNTITEEMPALIDPRKRQLFDLIYSSHGALSVQELSETVTWSSRQINRYFSHWLGLSLKAYCNILRFRASFQQIKEGKLFPEQDFADQAHFIKEIKKFAGVVPKELSKNKNDRFIQFSTLRKK